MGAKKKLIAVAAAAVVLGLDGPRGEAARCAKRTRHPARPTNSQITRRLRSSPCRRSSPGEVRAVGVLRQLNAEHPKWARAIGGQRNHRNHGANRPHNPPPMQCKKRN
jgi:hypothetical protein